MLLSTSVLLFKADLPKYDGNHCGTSPVIVQEGIYSLTLYELGLALRKLDQILYQEYSGKAFLFINTSKLFSVAWMKEMGNTSPDSDIGIWQVKIQAQLLLVRILMNSM